MSYSRIVLFTCKIIIDKNIEFKIDYNRICLIKFDYIMINSTA